MCKTQLCGGVRDVSLCEVWCAAVFVSGVCVWLFAGVVDVRHLVSPVLALIHLELGGVCCQQQVIATAPLTILSCTPPTLMPAGEQAHRRSCAVAQLQPAHSALLLPYKLLGRGVKAGCVQCCGPSPCLALMPLCCVFWQVDQRHHGWCGLATACHSQPAWPPGSLSTTMPPGLPTPPPPLPPQKMYQLLHSRLGQL